jgi:hypothetical protein
MVKNHSSSPKKTQDISLIFSKPCLQTPFRIRAYLHKPTVLYLLRAILNQSSFFDKNILLITRFFTTMLPRINSKVRH